MVGHAANVSNTTKSVTDLPFLLVETSTGQSFCIVIKLYFEALWLCFWVLVRKSLSFSDIFVFVGVVCYFPSCCAFICILCVAFCPKAT